MKIRIKNVPQQHSNDALNSRKWKHGLGGNLFGDGSSLLKGKYEPGGIRVPYTNSSLTEIPDIYPNPQKEIDFYANWLDNRREVLEQNMRDTQTYSDSGVIDTLKNWKSGYEDGRIALNKEIYNQLNRAASAIYEYDSDYSPVLNKNDIGKTITDSKGNTTIYIKPGLGSKKTSSTILHELTHTANAPRTLDGVYLDNPSTSPQEKKIEQLGIQLQPLSIDKDVQNKYPYFVKGLEHERKYLTMPSEIYARIMEFRMENKLNPKHKYTKEEIAPLIKKSQVSGVKEYNLDDFVRALNEVASNGTRLSDNMAAYGGNLLEMGGPTQDNDPATKDWEHRREHEEVRPQYKRTEKDEEYWQEKNRRNAEAAEKLNRQKDVVMSGLEQQANSIPFTGEAYKSAVDEQRQKVLDKAKDYEKGAKSVITAAELGLSGASLLGAYANWRNWANAANLTKRGIANLLQKAQAPMQEAGTLIDAYQTMDAAGNNDFDTYYNGASGLLGVAGTIGASDVFRGRHPYVDRALDALGIIQNTGDYLKFGYDTFFGSPDNKKALGGNLFSGEEDHSSQINIGLNATNGWQPYTLGDIVTNGERVARQRKALQDTFLNFPVESNDATAVANGRSQNTHLEGKAVRGGAANAAWEKEHPGLAQLGYAASAVPFAIASAPLLGAAAETGAGQAVTAGLGWLGNAAGSSPLFTNAASRALGTSTLLPWLDAGMTAGFGAHGIQETAEGNFTPMTAFEIAPLGRLAKPIAKEAALAVENYRYPLGRPQVPENFLTVNPQVRTRVGDVEIDNPNLLYHLDRGDGAGAFSTQGAYVEDGVLFPGTPKDDTVIPYSWWNKGKPYAVNVGGQPMTRLMTTTEDTPGMLHVRSQNYPIGQWNGRRGFVTNAEYVDPEGVDVSGSTYTLDPDYGWRRVFAEETPAAEWAMGRTAPEITAENAASITPEQWTAAQDAAIARGDMVEAQRLRDLHFKAAAPNSVSYEVFHHGNTKPMDWFTFDPARVGTTDEGYSGAGYYFAPTRPASQYSKEHFPHDLGPHGETNAGLSGGRYHRYVYLNGETKYEPLREHDWTTHTDLPFVDNRPIEVVVGDNRQIKLADAVTYDDNGVRIGLGDRDNFSNPDIRYDLPNNDIIIESNVSATPNIPSDEAWLAASKGRHQMNNLVGSDEYATRVRQAYQDNGIPVNQADFEVLQAKQGIKDSNLKVVPNLKDANGETLNGQYDPNTGQILVSQDRENILDIVESSGHEHAHASEVDKLLDLLKEKWKHIKPRKEAFTRSDGSIDTEWKDYISKTIEMRAPAMSVWSEMKELGFSKVGDYLNHLKRFGLEDKQWEALVNRYGLTNAKYMVETVFGLSPFVIYGNSNEEKDNTAM